MFRHGEISTEVDRKPFVFTLVAFLGSITAAVLILVFAWGQGLATFAGILFAVVAVAAGAVLLALVTDRAYVEDGTLHLQYLFRKKAIPVSEIGKITFRDEVYSVYDGKGNVAGTMNGRLTGIGTVIYALDQSGVRFE